MEGSIQPLASVCVCSLRTPAGTKPTKTNTVLEIAKFE